MTFQTAGFIDLKRGQNITHKFPGLNVNHIAYTRISVVFIFYCYYCSINICYEIGCFDHI